MINSRPHFSGIHTSSNQKTGIPVTSKQSICITCRFKKNGSRTYVLQILAMENKPFRLLFRYFGVLYIV